jgi:hypothetical protein
MQLKIAVRNIGRLEKRKFLRIAVSKKIASEASSWWKSVVFDDSPLYGASGSVGAPAGPSSDPKTPKLLPSVYPLRAVRVHAAVNLISFVTS